VKFEKTVLPLQRMIDGQTPGNTVGSKVKGSPSNQKDPLPLKAKGLSISIYAKKFKKPGPTQTGW
jgi:hypothetical protein